MAFGNVDQGLRHGGGNPDERRVIFRRVGVWGFLTVLDLWGWLLTVNTFPAFLYSIQPTI